MALISFAEYARRRGVSRMTVTRWVRDGKITAIEHLGERYIDEGVADRQMPHIEKPGGGYAEPSAPKTEMQPASVKETAEGREEALLPTHSLTKNRAVKEHYNARLAKLAFEQRSGKLVEEEEVQKQAFVIARRVRDSLLSIPDRVSAELAAEPNQFKIHARLTAEIRKALIALKDLIGDGSGELRENQEEKAPGS